MSSVEGINTGKKQEAFEYVFPIQQIRAAIEGAEIDEDRDELARLHGIAAAMVTTWSELAQTAIDAQTRLDPEDQIHG